MSANPLITIKEAVLYPTVPIVKNALVGITYLIDLDRKNYVVIYGFHTSSVEKTLYKLGGVVLASGVLSARPISNIISYEYKVPFEPSIEGADVIELRSLEESVNRIILRAAGGEPLRLLTVRGYLIYRSLVGLVKLARAAAGHSIDLPPVARIDGYYTIAPAAVGLLKEVRLRLAEVPVLEGVKAVDLSPDEIAALALQTAELAPEAMSTANRIVQQVVKALEARLNESIRRKVTTDAIVRAFGAGLEAAAETVLSARAVGSASEAASSGSPSGASDSRQQAGGEVDEKVAQAIDAILEGFG